MNRIPPDLLYRLRNDVGLPVVLEHLGIPTKRRGDRLLFRCPDCGTCHHTAISHYQKLARCFQCQRNFNSIDLVMAERGDTFLEAVDYLRRMLGYQCPGQL